MTQNQAIKEIKTAEDKRRLEDYLEYVKLEAVKELVKKAGR